MMKREWSNLYIEFTAQIADPEYTIDLRRSNVQGEDEEDIA